LPDQKGIYQVGVAAKRNQRDYKAPPRIASWVIGTRVG
jgi:hypothetical protein